MRIQKLKYREVTIVTNLKTKKEYVLQGYVACCDYLIPLVPHWNGGTTTESWEPHYAKRDTWISMDEIDFNEWDITKEEYSEIQKEDKKTYAEILAKYHASF